MIENDESPRAGGVPPGSPALSLAESVPAGADPARTIGEIFRRLVLAGEAFPGQAFDRIVHAVLVALGRASMEEAERHAKLVQERANPARPGVRVSATARRVDFDAWDPGDPN
ncbi:hypothetical protein [Methylobacterium radiotolerans]|uniref:hypothetical protein n=1 Tax=Methylobacterium radiotolerans TaxID=31998 RepID=UPI001F1C832F|nr:hypothetical protein [Methylobacterium radiotolerans]UIY44209.1 hypothetical protein LZ599_11180 [Methylobacterium radiotolerans]